MMCPQVKSNFFALQIRSHHFNNLVAHPVGVTGDNFQTLTEHWDGSSWSIIPSPNVGPGQNVFSPVLDLSPINAWAGGGSSSVAGISPDRTLFEHWDGSTWSVVPSPSPGLSFNDISGLAAIPGTNNLWAAGAYTDSGGPNGIYHSIIERWDGSSWSVVPSPNVGTAGGSVGSVVALSATDAWAVGSFRDSNGMSQTLVEHRDGSSWSVVPSPNVGSESNGLVLSQSSIAKQKEGTYP
jgi:hypothetical protein